MTAQESFKIKNADNPSAAKQRIEELKAKSERSGVGAISPRGILKCGRDRINNGNIPI